MQRPAPLLAGPLLAGPCRAGPLLVATLLLATQLAAPATAAESPAGPSDGPPADATWSRWGKSTLRWMVTGSTGGADPRFGVAADADWRSAPRDATRVVLLHGFNGSPASMAPLADALRRRGHPCAVACYPNDQAIERTARRVARELRPLVAEAGGAPVAVVSHSMGGLVARRVLEDPRLDPGGVDRLVMIATPNHGSNLARLSAGTDLYEHLCLPEGGGRKTGFYHSFDDGMGEATHDLRPGSRFLRRLNARPRNPRVAYTIILGDRGRFSDTQLEAVRKTFAAAAGRRSVSWLAPRVEQGLSECDELIAGRGDGAVAVRRGRLAGVDDVHVLPATHDVIALRGEAADRLLTLVADRL